MHVHFFLKLRANTCIYWKSDMRAFLILYMNCIKFSINKLFRNAVKSYIAFLIYYTFWDVLKNV